MGGGGGGYQISVLNLRNAHVACRHLFIPLSPVDFKNHPCPMSILSNGHVPCRYNFKASVQCH